MKTPCEVCNPRPPERKGIASDMVIVCRICYDKLMLLVTEVNAIPAARGWIPGARHDSSLDINLPSSPTP